jgi:hypothetical protein
MGLLTLNIWWSLAAVAAALVLTRVVVVVAQAVRSQT